MFKNLILLPLFFLLLVISNQANALLMFGSSDSIRIISNVSVKGANGQELFLGYRVTTKAFLLPYYVKSNGYVLGIKGDSKKYYPLPEKPVLDALQTRGELPNPFPPIKQRTVDYLIGYSLWISLLFIFGVPFIKRQLKK